MKVGKDPVEIQIPVYGGRAVWAERADRGAGGAERAGRGAGGVERAGRGAGGAERAGRAGLGAETVLRRISCVSSYK